jgi:opacity protein-like surface antigen
MTAKRCLIAIAVAVLVVPVWADSPELTAENPGPEPSRQSEQPRATGTTETTGHSTKYSAGSDIGWQGWGLRVGVADDPDQVVGGVHFNLGEFVPHLRFQPDVQLGVGDDFTTLYATAPVYYRFGTETRFTPYAGGGVSLGFVDRDLPAGSNADDTEFEIGGKVTGGMEWPRSRSKAFFLELSLGFGDIHDAFLVAGWSF